MTDPFKRLYRNTSLPLLASVWPATRLVAMLVKTIVLPSPLMIGLSEALFPVVLSDEEIWLTRVRVPVRRLKRKMSGCWALPSTIGLIKSVAALSKAMKLPSPLILGLPVKSLAVRFGGFGAAE